MCDITITSSELFSFFFFKQKTAYEMRISDWSSDVCSSDLARLQPVRGRLERAAITRAGAPVYVDYAHTPDGLEAALDALRPHASGRLILVFGAGGDRDRDKRAAMGRVAAAKADLAIITDDNPRGEIGRAHV